MKVVLENMIIYFLSDILLDFINIYTFEDFYISSVLTPLPFVIPNPR
jgi:hypothetical protein